MTAGARLALAAAALLLTMAAGAPDTSVRPPARPAAAEAVAARQAARKGPHPRPRPVRELALPPLPVLGGLSPDLVAPPPVEVRTASATDPRPRPRPATEAAASDTGVRRAGPTDPRPRPRPTGRLAAVALRDSEAPTAAPADPRPQPLPEVAKASVRLAVLAVPTSIRPLARPDAPIPAPVIKAAAAMVRPETGQRFGRRGAVCGIPSLKGTEIAPIPAKVAGCGLADPVRITSVEGIPLSVPATVDCATAAAFQKWVKGSVIPTVGRTGGGVSGIEIAASYSCRPRNGVKGARVSEHGRGHAIDVSGLTLRNGQSINVLRDWGQEEKGQILATLWKAACGPFGTVLGPRSDRFHQNHIHLDTARYRAGSYCR